MRVSNIIRTISAMVALLLLCSVSVSAQYHKERKCVREGNESFQKKNYKTAYDRYNEALEHDPRNYEALYNRATAYTQMRRSETKDTTLSAETEFLNYENIAADTLLSKRQRAEVFRNLGESLFNESKYKEALNAFRESLLLNPDDKETKYDYVLTKRIVDQMRHQNQNQDKNYGGDSNHNDNSQNQNNENNQDQNDSQGDQSQKNNEDKKPEGDNSGQDNKKEEDKQQGDEDKQQNGEGEDKSDEQNGEQQSQPKELNLDQERMLDAIQAEEDKTQEKIKEGKKGVIVSGKKNW